MKLSTNLIKEFAKITNTKQENKKETIVYGKITRYDSQKDQWYVMIDGSELETPVANFTSTVDTDERVIVMIKNHSIVVTGNIGSPSTSQTYVDTKLYPKIQTEETVTQGGLQVQNYYSIEFDENNRPIFKVIDNTRAEETEKEKVYDLLQGDVDSITEEDIDALFK